MECLGVTRIALGLEYDGSRFCGWQRQPAGCGVQDALEKALASVAAEPVQVTAAGRTDAGVHAAQQVVHFDVTAKRPVSAWVRGANALLPSTVAVLWAIEVPGDFHARFNAIGRRYRYVLLNRPPRSGLHSGRVGWYHAPLDADAMAEAATLLLGRHDFSAFRAAECQARSPIKELRQLDVRRYEDWVIIDAHADGFLHHMVRNIVGCLVYVGNGRHPTSWITEILEERDRRRAAPTFSPEGLYLTGIEYDPAWAIPSDTPRFGGSFCF